MRKWRDWTMLAAGVLFCTLALVLATAQAVRGADGGRPVYPAPVCVTVNDAQCAALLTNSWDGRQVVHQLEPVPVCAPNRSVMLQHRLDRKNHTLAVVRAKVARLRERLAR